jgi:hypothetical protein
MRRLILVLALLAGTLITAKAQSNGDFQNLYFGLYGVERVTDIKWHYGGAPGYYQIVAEIQCVIDSAYFVTGKSSIIGGKLLKGDTLFAGRTYPFAISKLKLKTGRALLYKNRGVEGTNWFLRTPTTYLLTVTVP